jgi:TolB-like protein
MNATMQFFSKFRTFTSLTLCIGVQHVALAEAPASRPKIATLAVSVVPYLYRSPLEVNAEDLSDLLIASLNRHGEFRISSARKIKSTLRKREKSAYACFINESCLLSVSNQLDVEYFLAGTLSTDEISKKTRITLKAFDAKHNKVLWIKHKLAPKDPAQLTASIVQFGNTIRFPNQLKLNKNKPPQKQTAP